MSIPELCIRRPVMITLVMLGTLAFGLLAYLKLPVSDLPTVDFPTISVSTNLPGASPETMASSVATPLEKAFSTIPGIDSMTSSSSLGSTNITLQFDLSRHIDDAALDVQSAISSALRRLPPDLPSPPSFRKINPAESPVLFLVLSSKTTQLSKIDEYAQNLLSPRISTITGVAQVGIYGSQKYAVRVQANPAALASRGISISEVQDAIKKNNSNLPTGTLESRDQTFTVKTSGQIDNAAGYRSLILGYREGAAVRLGDVANVIDSVENDLIAPSCRRAPLTIWASAPASTPSARSSGLSSEVTRTTGKFFVLASLRIIRVSSKPSMRGICTSVTTSFTGSVWRMFQASSPSAACFVG